MRARAIDRSIVGGGIMVDDAALWLFFFFRLRVVAFVLFAEMR